MFQSGNNDTFDVQERHMYCGGYWLRRVSGDTSEDQKNCFYTQTKREREREAQLSLSLLLEFTVAPGHQPLRPPSSGRVSFVDLRPLWCIGPAHVFLVYMNQAVHVNKLMNNTP